ncbi:LarC family nickel insertion protein [Acidisoma cellulosilytica]|uniref:LarC family nickel insertion protein n=1 Tax=Acidisoma cellulosilyticum TaxID=2802395 RepID=A0A963Z5N3_9PROT|nr:LarC family nickel insertion protein [Acidisoma cellulosilyticum]MCB8882263.1 LarC family nickel insertion protein [Acidisoma cellulosilyticum]
MTKTAIMLDAVGGIAGDMFVSAMVDALPALRERVLADAAAVLPEGAGVPRLEPGMSGGLRCLRFGLAEPGHHHHAAHFAAMVARIEAAALSPGTAVQAIAILRLLAESEAAIHGTAVEDVHFHEIGDWDSLMDVVAAGSIAAALPGVDWAVSDLPRGGGMVRTAHGLLPVPAPATMRLLTGFAWRDDGVSGERVTPTGAAILRHLVSVSGDPISGVKLSGVAGRLRASGTGAGTRELSDLPNVLRATVFETSDSGGAEDILVLSFDIDDMTGEEIGIAADRLRARDTVRDLVISTAFGKKGRVVHVFRLMLRAEDQAAVAEACFAETSTIGLRWHMERRAILPRRAETSDGVRIKIATRGTGSSRKAESDDLMLGASLEARRAAKRRAEEG